jgi:hypothetical protein
MLARLGDELYWVGCAIAGCLVLIAFIAALNGHEHDWGLIVGAFFLVAKVIAWLIGRACRYVLAGR